MRLILTFIILSLVSCDNRYGVEFIIHNGTTLTIDSARFSTSDKLATVKLTDIHKGQTKAGFLDMTDIKKTDGDYVVEINTPGTAKIKKIGYYTNGFPMDERIEVYFGADTIKYKSQIRQY